MGSRHAMERALSQRSCKVHGTQGLDDRCFERGSPDEADEAKMTAIPVTDSARPHADGAIVESDIPARLERLPWGRFHTLVVVALGITWILDGLEVTLAGAVSPALKESHQLHFSNADVLARERRLSRRRGARRDFLRLAHRPAGTQ